MASTTKTQEQTNVIVRTRTDCRLCGSTNLTRIWSFGETPLANEYILPADIDKPEPFAPLDVYKCDDCHLVQLRDVVDPNVLFGNYLYVSSTSPAFVAHFEEYARTVTDRFDLEEDDLVVDIGSNDGVLLKPFQNFGTKVLGVEPAENIAAAANADGVPTVAEFFTPDVARKLKEQHGPAKVITANNVFAHTDGVIDMAAAIKEMLTDDGVFVFEVQYLGTLLKDNLFDIVYHEHVCYYHVHPLVQFFKNQEMDVFDVEQPAVHGGSLRVYVQRADGPYKHHKRLSQVLAAEKNARLNTLAPYKEFADRIADNKKKLTTFLQDLKSQGKRIAGYGAPAKATTLTYAFGIDGSILDYIVDDSPLKQGRLMPGTHIPIVSSADFKKNAPDYCLILAWNFADPIMKNNAFFTDSGGQWIVPVPEPNVVV